MFAARDIFDFLWIPLSLEVLRSGTHWVDELRVFPHGVLVLAGVLLPVAKVRGSSSVEIVPARVASHREEQVVGRLEIEELRLVVLDNVIELSAAVAVEI